MARVLQVIEPLPELASLDKGADIRDCAAKAKRKIEDYASKFSATGWSIDDESWEMAAIGQSILVRCHIVRPD